MNVQPLQVRPWKVLPPTAGMEPLIEALGLHPLVAQILVRRGMASPEAARRFLSPSLEHLHDPFLLKGMAEAVELVLATLGEGGRIVVSGDYDVDGVTSSALLTHFLRAAGCADLVTFVPNRFQHGYGLTPRTVDALLELKPALVVTVDNGITAIEEVERMQRAGIRTVISDHHLPRAEGVPPGVVVNPLQPGCQYPFKRISGCGVTLKLVTALRKRLREQGRFGPQRHEPNLKDYLDLVAIGTVADVVPLLEENRVLAYFGLEVLNRPRRRPGVEALLEVSRSGQGAIKPSGVTARTIGFQIGPRLNAAGRMTEGSVGVDLLLEQDVARARELAQRLDQDNSERRAKGNAMFKEALERIEAAALHRQAGIVVASPAFHEGIIGIVASRLVEHFGKPAVVLAQNGPHYKGSARSLPGINVTEAIATCAPLLIEYGGHAGAAGCKLPQERLAEFSAGFAQACERLGRGIEPPGALLEARLGAADATAQLAEQLAALEPFGQDHEEPHFLVEGGDLPAPPQVLKGQHLKWALGAGAEMLAWRMADRLPGVARGSFRVRIGTNEFRGERRVQWTVEEAREQAGEESAVPPG